ncbi:hypothetical protein VNO77_10048 [Canavalia gladiata]|uniref:Uncharacterized protein n=1 Tax=Canavalia gladiata TaxID=3824 RepID=A0AAN9QXM9_CANGL
MLSADGFTRLMPLFHRCHLNESSKSHQVNCLSYCPLPQSVPCIDPYKTRSSLEEVGTPFLRIDAIQPSLYTLEIVPVRLVLELQTKFTHLSIYENHVMNLISQSKILM